MRQRPRGQGVLRQFTCDLNPADSTFNGFLTI
jgi:hypothetical protein